VINSDEGNNPFEVFVNVGKAGTDIMADAEAIGRLVSLSLRIPSDLSSKEIAAQVVEQLRGIGGASQVGFGNGRVRSIADGVSKVLKEHLGFGLAQIEAEETVQQEALPLTKVRLVLVCGQV
jgi:ribonucleoside-diphosphate reductase alpha chain